MTIWHLLSVMAFFAPLISSLQTARTAETGVGAYILSVLSGLILGAICAGALWRASKKIFAHFSQRSTMLRVLVVIPVLSMAIGWIVLGGFCGERATLALLRIA